MRVAVVGGGPSGLVTLKYLKTAHLYFDIDPIDATLYEAESTIGGTFVYRVYDDAEVSTRSILCPFLSFPWELLALRLRGPPGKPHADVKYADGVVQIPHSLLRLPLGAQ